MADSQDKTEEATPKRLKDARKKGQVFSSQDVAVLISLIVVFSAMRLLFGYMTERVMNVMEHYQDAAAAVTELTQGQVREQLGYGFLSIMLTAMPIVLIALVVGILATGVQTRFLFSMEPLKPKFEKINPLKGFKRMFSLKSLVALIKNLLKVTVISAVIYVFVKGHIVDYARMLQMDLTASSVYFLKNIYTMVMEICLFFLIVAGADYLYERWDYKKNMRMSKQEVKEEYKQQEGDPQVKGRIRNLQRSMSMSRMMQAVPEADVIIRNPTHFAVAMKYNPDKDIAPRIVAKGADELALRIVRVGEENGVYITENPELTRAIYAAADIGDLLPAQFYTAVADILALVYRMRESKI